MTSRAPRCFLLSPAHSGGRRAQILLRPEADFPLARQVRSDDGAPIGEVYAFLSGLYFRGKLAYARAFAPEDRVRVIVPGQGLWRSDARVTLADLHRIARVPVDLADPRYLRPLVRDAKALAAGHPGGEVVLLGSIATDKYVSPLEAVFGDRLRFPAEFVGRGDMSRGGLLLRQVDEGRELIYVRIADVSRHGARPPRLAPRPARRASSATTPAIG